MVDAQQMQYRGLKVVNRDGILNGLEAKIVRSSVSHAWLDPSTCHPDGKSVGVVIATPGFDFLDFALKEWGSAKFATPDDQRFIEQATTF
jgi:predicted cupin superfamily sugar epimerase